MRHEFEMTQKQLDKVLEACKPTPVMFLSGGVAMGRTPQQNANDAWRKLGDEMGFKWDTAQPMPGCCQRHFTAEAKEPDDDA